MRRTTSFCVDEIKASADLSTALDQLRLFAESPDFSQAEAAAQQTSTAPDQAGSSGIGVNDALDAVDAALEQVAEESMRCDAASIDVEALVPLRPIGIGGQGGVWLARDPSIDRKFAVKQYNKARLSSMPRKVGLRALNELECLQDCGHHPFLIGCYGSFQTHSSLFIVLEVAPGGDLFTLDFRYGLPETSTRFYVSSVVLALRHMHTHGWLYRDIKLENVLIDGRGYAKLCDFGFAKKAANLRTFTQCGTDEYAAPELVLGEGRGVSADWWALGILVHELFTGKPPFQGTPDEVHASIVQFTEGGERALDQLHSSVLRRAASNGNFETLSDAGADFMRDLLTADESRRLGAGPNGYAHARTAAAASCPDDASPGWAQALRRRGPKAPPHTITSRLLPPRARLAGLTTPPTPPF